MHVMIVAGFAQSLVNFRGPLIEALVADGHRVSAIGPAADSATLTWLRARGVAYHVAPLERGSLNPLHDVGAFLAIRRTLMKTQPEAVVAYTIKAVIYGLLAARFSGIARRFAMITGLGYAFTEGDLTLKRRLISGLARRLYRLSLLNTEAVIFQNPDDLAVFQQLQLIGQKHRVGIVNGSGVDIRHFEPSVLPAEPAFLMIARLVADKGVAEYLAAARMIKVRRPECVFRLAGPVDPNPAALPKGLLQKAVQDGVLEYLGELADVRPAIAASSIYVLPSYREGTPRSVLEAMAMARPVITTDAPGCRETVEHGVNGLLVPVRDVPSLVDAMLMLADKPDLRNRMGEAGHARAVSRYSAENVARSVLDILSLDRTTVRLR